MTKEINAQSQPIPQDSVRDSRTQILNRDSFCYDVAPLIEAGDKSLVLLVLHLGNRTRNQQGN